MPGADNKYYVTVFTGMRPKSGTSANVCIVIIGKSKWRKFRFGFQMTADVLLVLSLFNEGHAMLCLFVYVA